MTSNATYETSDNLRHIAERGADGARILTAATTTKELPNDEARTVLIVQKYESEDRARKGAETLTRVPGVLRAHPSKMETRDRWQIEVVWATKYRKAISLASVRGLDESRRIWSNA